MQMFEYNGQTYLCSFSWGLDSLSVPPLASWLQSADLAAAGWSWRSSPPAAWHRSSGGPQGSAWTP